MMEFTPAARNELQHMDANTASELSKRAEVVAKALGKRMVGKETLAIAALVDDETLDAMAFTEDSA